MRRAALLAVAALIVTACGDESDPSAARDATSDLDASHANELRDAPPPLPDTTIAEPDTADLEADSDVADPVDTTPPPPVDSDGDGLVDELDNCPDVANPDQADDDGDGLGNACDDDRDNDTVPDAYDPRPDDPRFPGVASASTVYAHTSSTLYQLDVKTYDVTRVGDFRFPASAESTEMTDLAIDRWGVIYAISFNDLFICHAQTAECIRLARLPGSFNGLTWVPRGVLDPEREVLVGISGLGEWYRIDIDAPAGTATATLVGSYGQDYSSSGDAYSISGQGTFASVNVAGANKDFLARLEPTTGAVQSLVGDLGYDAIWGLAGWTNSAFAFDESGAILRVDTSTGQVTLLANTGHAWWGAGVRTVIVD